MTEPFTAVVCPPPATPAGTAVVADLTRAGGVVSAAAEPWAEQLAAVRRCDLFVVLLTRAGLASHRFQTLLAYAVALGRPLLPVLVDDLPLELLPEDLARTQAIDYRTRTVQSGIALAVAVTHRPSPPPLPDPLPPAPTEPPPEASTVLVAETEPPNYPHATLLIVLSIIGLLTTPVPVLSLPVWLIARRTLRSIDNSGTSYANRDLVFHACRIALVGVVFHAAVWVAFGILLLVLWLFA